MPREAVAQRAATHSLDDFSAYRDPVDGAGARRGHGSSRYQVTIYQRTARRFLEVCIGEGLQEIRPCPNFLIVKVDC
jgi:hypothetical protein